MKAGKKCISKNQTRCSISCCYAAAFIFLVTFSWACEDDFTPLKSTDEYFYSVYGYLDASADTQWIRIMPVREEYEPVPRPIDAFVTLEDQTNNKQVVMNDSLFQPTDSIGLWNFWSDLEVQPEAMYQLKVQRSDGIESKVQVSIPPDFPTPVIEPQGGDILVINGVKNLADVHTVWKVRNNITRQNFVYRFSHRDDTIQPGDADYKILLDETEDLGLIQRRFEGGEGATFSILQQQIFIASAGPEWVNFRNLDEIVIALPDGISNVENGVGYMVGVLSKSIPWRTCYGDEDEEEVVACEVQEPIDDI